MMIKKKSGIGEDEGEKYVHHVCFATIRSGWCVKCTYRTCSVPFLVDVYMLDATDKAEGTLWQ